MPGAFGIDLRERVVEAYEESDKSQREIAQQFKVSHASVGRWHRLKQETGSAEPSDAPRGPDPSGCPAR